MKAYGINLNGVTWKDDFREQIRDNLFTLPDADDVWKEDLDYTRHDDEMEDLSDHDFLEKYFDIYENEVEGWGGPGGLLADLFTNLLGYTDAAVVRFEDPYLYAVPSEENGITAEDLQQAFESYLYPLMSSYPEPEWFDAPCYGDEER